MERSELERGSWGRKATEFIVKQEVKSCGCSRSNCTFYVTNLELNYMNKKNWSQMHYFWSLCLCHTVFCELCFCEISWDSCFSDLSGFDNVPIRSQAVFIFAKSLQKPTSWQTQSKYVSVTSVISPELWKCSINVPLGVYVCKGMKSSVKFVYIQYRLRFVCYLFKDMTLLTPVL